MSRTTMFALSLLLLGVNALVIAAGPLLADPLPDSDCLPKGTWQCIEEGTRICNYERPSCGGDCHVCVGNTTVPDKMCFKAAEGLTCTPLAPYICGVRYNDAVCIMVEGSCICKKDLIVENDGQCTFTSCNQ